MNNVVEKPGHGSFWISTLAIIGCFLIFTIILYIAYIPHRSSKGAVPGNLTEEERLERNILTPEERKERLVQMRAKENSEAASYGWVDQANGVVRLPIARAVELTARELEEEPTRELEEEPRSEP